MTRVSSSNPRYQPPEHPSSKPSQRRSLQHLSQTASQIVSSTLDTMRRLFSREPAVEPGTTNTDAFAPFDCPCCHKPIGPMTDKTCFLCLSTGALPHHCTDCRLGCCAVCCEALKTVQMELSNEDGEWHPVVPPDQLPDRQVFWVLFHAFYAPRSFRRGLLTCFQGTTRFFDDSYRSMIVGSAAAGDVDLVKLIVMGEMPGDTTDPVFTLVRDALATKPVYFSPTVHYPSASSHAWEPRHYPGAVEWAAIGGHTDCVEVLLRDGRYPPGALPMAAYNGHISCLEVMLRNCDVPWEDIAHAFENAASQGRIDYLKVLGADEDRKKMAHHFGSVARAASGGHTACIEWLLGVDGFSGDGSALLNAAGSGHVSCLRVLLADGRFDPSAQHNAVFTEAGRANQSDCLTLLLEDERVCPKYGREGALRGACQGGHVQLAKDLLAYPLVSPSLGYQSMRKVRDAECMKLLLATGDVHDSASLITAAENGWSDVVEQLLADEHVDPRVGGSDPIRMACKTGQADCVQLLLADMRVDPTAGDNEAIEFATSHGHVDCLRLLLADGRADPCAGIEAVLGGGFNHPKCLQLLLDDERVTLDRLSSREMNGNTLGHACLKLLFLSGRRDLPAVIPGLALDSASAQGDLELVKLILADQLARFNNRAVENASMNGHLDCLLLLLEDHRLAPPGAAVLQAFANGHAHCLKALLEDGRAQLPASTNIPSANTNTECVKLLLQDERIDPEHFVGLATKRFDLKVLELLLQSLRVDPNVILLWLCRHANNNHDDTALTMSARKLLVCVELVLEDPRVDASANDNFAFELVCHVPSVAFRLLQAPGVAANVYSLNRMRLNPKLCEFALSIPNNVAYPVTITSKDWNSFRPWFALPPHVMEIIKTAHGNSLVTAQLCLNDILNEDIERILLEDLCALSISELTMFIERQFVWLRAE